MDLVKRILKRWRHGRPDKATWHPQASQDPASRLFAGFWCTSEDDYAIRLREALAGREH